MKYRCYAIYLFYRTYSNIHRLYIGVITAFTILRVIIACTTNVYYFEVD